MNRFDSLTIEDKILLIEDIGTLVYSMEFYEHRLYLFSFSTFYVEVYRNIDNGQIDKIESITTGDLDKYLSRITLGNLVRESYIL